MDIFIYVENLNNMYCIEIISSLFKLYNLIYLFCMEFLLKLIVYFIGK